MESDHTLIHFCEQLKSKREAMGLSLEVVSSHLKLSTHIISELEQSSFNGLPSSFIKGYLKSYAKYLQFSDQEIQHFLQYFPDKSTHIKTTYNKMHPIKIQTKNQNKLVMRTFTVLLTLTLMTLSAAWWYNQADTNTEELISSIKTEQPVVAQNQARLFLQTVNAIQNPKQNFTSMPPSTSVSTGKAVALNNHSGDEEEDEDDEDRGTTDHD